MPVTEQLSCKGALRLYPFLHCFTFPDCFSHLIDNKKAVHDIAFSANHYRFVCNRPLRESNPQLALRSRPDTMKPSATQCKKILGNTRFFTVSNPIWYYAS